MSERGFIFISCIHIHFIHTYTFYTYIPIHILLVTRYALKMKTPHWLIEATRSLLTIVDENRYSNQTQFLYTQPINLTGSILGFTDVSEIILSYSLCIYILVKCELSKIGTREVICASNLVSFLYSRHNQTQPAFIYLLFILFFCFVFGSAAPNWEWSTEKSMNTLTCCRKCGPQAALQLQAANDDRERLALQTELETTKVELERTKAKLESLNKASKQAQASK